MIYSVFSLLLVLAEDTSNIEKALQFQYNQKLSKLEEENLKLKQKITELKQAQITQCSSPNDEPPEEFTIKGREQKSSTLNSFRKTNAKERERLYRSALGLAQAEQWNDAILAFENFAQEYAESELADNAIYWIAQIYLQKNEVGLARVELERLIKLYPHGDRAKRASARLLSLPGGETEKKGN